MLWKSEFADVPLSCLNGYDGSLMGGLNGMKAYQRYFNMFVAPIHCQTLSENEANHVPKIQD